MYTSISPVIAKENELFNELLKLKKEILVNDISGGYMDPGRLKTDHLSNLPFWSTQ